MTLPINGRGASFSLCRLYRYALWRDTGATPTEIDKVLCLFIGLNPSTADEDSDDPTVRRCVGFGRRWGFSRVVLVNLFAFRTTDPRNLASVPDPVGRDANDFINFEVGMADRIVAAWGNGGLVRRDVRDLRVRREREVLALLRGKPLLCLGTNFNGEPRHPLYVPADRAPEPWSPR